MMVLTMNNNTTTTTTPAIQITIPQTFAGEKDLGIVPKLHRMNVITILAMFWAIWVPRIVP